ncbi:MAG: GNAT family N-acetyltransferase [candidate division WOR-3 bacterium]|nr:GNAT family N-acetyltransferase [candidate division WOR-3 bacterium]MCX7837198.1 GNAT family N-acetyltransferase [candidate division WOR-3 bacterium]MDW8113964.1 GNAT family N-acetyltransferase [candidate division WOR-3 bacterium]
MRREIIDEIIKKILLIVPTKSLQAVKDFIDELPQAKITLETPKKFQVNEFIISFYQYQDIITNEKLLEIWFSYPGEPIGYVRLDPDWKEGLKEKEKHRWEITRAYVRPKFRGQGFSRLFCEVGIELAKANKAYSIVGYPRHVGMLITFLDYGFKTQTGALDATLHRILRQGRRWYSHDPSQRRLYYASEFRPFIQEGSFIMEKVLQNKKWWQIFLEKI